MAVVGESAAVGIPRAFDEAAARLRSYRDAGVDRVMLQHLRHRDIEAIAEIPRLTAGAGLGASSARTAVAKRRAMEPAALHSGT